MQRKKNKGTVTVITSGIHTGHFWLNIEVSRNMKKKIRDKLGETIDIEIPEHWGRDEVYTYLTVLGIIDD